MCIVMGQVVSATEMTSSISIYYMHNITVTAGQHNPFLSSHGIIITTHNNAQLSKR